MFLYNKKIGGIVENPKVKPGYISAISSKYIKKNRNGKEEGQVHGFLFQ